MVVDKLSTPTTSNREEIPSHPPQQSYLIHRNAIVSSHPSFLYILTVNDIGAGLWGKGC